MKVAESIRLAKELVDVLSEEAEVLRRRSQGSEALTKERQAAAVARWLHSLSRSERLSSSRTAFINGSDKPKEGFTMDEKRMTPAEAWEGFVGSQTVAEFVEAAKKNYGDVDVDALCTCYAYEMPTMFNGWRAENPDANLDDIAALLARYVRQTLSNVREGW